MKIAPEPLKEALFVAKRNDFLNTTESWRTPTKRELVEQTSAVLRLIGKASLACSSVWCDTGKESPMGLDLTDHVYTHAVQHHALLVARVDTLQMAEFRNWTVVSDMSSQSFAKFCGEDDVELGTSVAAFLALDNRRTGEPTLDANWVEDRGKGLWELFPAGTASGEDLQTITFDKPYEARDPSIDVRDTPVAIDFGTTSTVVALRNAHGAPELLRVGSGSADAAFELSDFENPTVVEVIGLDGLLQAWREAAHRPLTLWRDVNVSHQAKEHLNDKLENPKVVASVLSGLKQWPVRNAGRHRRISDQADSPVEYSVPPMSAALPVHGDPAQLTDDYALDPIELYAYYLGLAINHRRRGIYLEYYMTFPAAYGASAKGLLLASFSRGLKRSLPEQLADSPRLNDFKVEERASEPAAFAAAAMKSLNLGLDTPPTRFAVFDFGGGTADFACGIWRRASDTNPDEAGFEHVLEDRLVAGDTTLGGDHLVEQLAWFTAVGSPDNAAELMKHKIRLARPFGLDLHPGAEAFIDDSNAAQCNTRRLAQVLRHRWLEFGKTNSLDSVHKVTLLPPVGGAVTVNLAVSAGRVFSFLTARILKGVVTFASMMARGLPAELDGNSPTRIFLAGNASRATAVGRLFLATFGDESAPTENKKQRQPTQVTPTTEFIRRALSALQMTQASSPQSSDQVGQEHGADLWVRQIDRLTSEAFPKSFLNERMTLLAQACAVAYGESPEAVGAVGGQLGGDLSKFTPQLLRVKVGELIDPLAKSRFIVSPPFDADPLDSGRPTAKTGVALGLLWLVPGEPILYSTLRDPSGPFAYFLGRYQTDRFQPVLLQGAPYMQWRELGKAIESVVVIPYSASAAAMNGTIRRGSPDVRELRIKLDSGHAAGRSVFVRAVDPTTFELTVASGENEILSASAGSLRVQRVEVPQ